MTPFPVDFLEDIYSPPPTSLMTNPSTRSDDRRPLWVEFQIHSPSSSSATDTSLTTEVNQQLRRLDSMLSNGPEGHNTLHLAEVPASTCPHLTGALAIDKRDFVCVAELSILVSTLNTPSNLVANIVTRFGTVGEDDRAVLRGNYTDLLCYLSRDLFFAWVREGDMEAVVRKSMGDEEPGLVMRPGFTMLLQRYVLELAAEMARLGQVQGD